MGEQYALRRARRAGSVHEERRRVLIERLELETLRGIGEKLRGIDVDRLDGDLAREQRQGLGELRRLCRRSEQDLAVAMIERIGEAGARASQVERRHHEAADHGAEKKRGGLIAVRHQERDLVPGAQSARLQLGRERSRLAQQAGVAENPARFLRMVGRDEEGGGSLARPHARKRCRASFALLRSPVVAPIRSRLSPAPQSLHSSLFASPLLFNPHRRELSLKEGEVRAKYSPKISASSGMRSGMTRETRVMLRKCR